MTGPVLPGEDVSSALALVNTRHNSPSGTVDHLVSKDQARQWLIDRGLLASGAALDAGGLDRLHALRDAVRDLLNARARGTQPSAESIVRVNAIANTAPRTTRLTWTSAGPSVSNAPRQGSLEQSLAALATDAIELVCGPLAERLIVCGAPGCVRVIVRDHPRRHWCSRACGDRVRAARYYARHHPGGEGQRGAAPVGQ